MKMPQTIGLVHFIGIGGIGMSGIAEVLHNLGYRVQGSDQADSANVQRLRDKGIECFVGHKRRKPRRRRSRRRLDRRSRSPIRNCKAARERLLPIVRRAEMLAELMRFRQAIAIGGTHGKTTTTSMVATLLDAGGLDPTVVNGGIINAYGTNARMGEGEWMVVEADESDGTFLKLPADIAVVTNIDPEHLDHYGTFEQGARGFPAVRRERALLRLRRDVHRPSRSAGAGLAHRGPPRHHLWRQRAGRRALHAAIAWTARRRVFDVVIRDRKTGSEIVDRRVCACRCPAATTSPTRPRRSPWRTSSASTRTPSGRGCRRSAASSGASRRPAHGTACRYSTTTATIRSRSRRC